MKRTPKRAAAAASVDGVDPCARLRITALVAYERAHATREASNPRHALASCVYLAEILHEIGVRPVPEVAASVQPWRTAMAPRRAAQDLRELARDLTAGTLTVTIGRAAGALDDLGAALDVHAPNVASLAPEGVSPCRV